MSGNGLTGTLDSACSGLDLPAPAVRSGGSQRDRWHIAAEQAAQHRRATDRGSEFGRGKHAGKRVKAQRRPLRVPPPVRVMSRTAVDLEGPIGCDPSEFDQQTQARIEFAFELAIFPSDRLSLINVSGLKRTGRHRRRFSEPPCLRGALRCALRAWRPLRYAPPARLAVCLIGFQAITGGNRRLDGGDRGDTIPPRGGMRLHEIGMEPDVRARMTGWRRS